MIGTVFIGRIDMRLGPPKSVFWDLRVVLGAFSIEMQKQLSLGVSVALMIFSSLTELPLDSPQVGVGGVVQLPQGVPGAVRARIRPVGATGSAQRVILLLKKSN